MFWQHFPFSLFSLCSGYPERVLILLPVRLVDLVSKTNGVHEGQLQPNVTFLQLCGWEKKIRKFAHCISFI